MGIVADDLADRMIEQGIQFKPEVLMRVVATKLRSESFGYVVTGESGDEYPTKTIIITAGAGAFSPAKLEHPRETEYENRGLVYGVPNIEFFSDKRVAVVGGGDSACDWALALEPICKEVHLIHRSDRLRAHENTVNRLKSSSVQMHLGSVVKELNGHPNLQSVVIGNPKNNEKEENLSVNLLSINIGFRTTLGPICAWGLEVVKNQIVVNQRMETNLPGIYAAGDVCVHPAKLKLIATGVAEAATAACFAKIHIDPFAKVSPRHSSDRDI